MLKLKTKSRSSGQKCHLGPLFHTKLGDLQRHSGHTAEHVKTDLALLDGAVAANIKGLRLESDKGIITFQIFLLIKNNQQD